MGAPGRDSTQRRGEISQKEKYICPGLAGEECIWSRSGCLCQDAFRITSDRQRFIMSLFGQFGLQGWLFQHLRGVTGDSGYLSLSTQSSTVLVSVHSPEMVVSNIGGCVCSCSGLWGRVKSLSRAWIIT